MCLFIICTWNSLASNVGRMAFYFLEKVTHKDICLNIFRKPTSAEYDLCYLFHFGLFSLLYREKWMIVVLSVLRHLSGLPMDNVDIVRSALLVLLGLDLYVMIRTVASASPTLILSLWPRFVLLDFNYLLKILIICNLLSWFLRIMVFSQNTVVSPVFKSRKW